MLCDGCWATVSTSNGLNFGWGIWKFYSFFCWAFLFHDLQDKKLKKNLDCIQHQLRWHSARGLDYAVDQSYHIHILKAFLLLPSGRYDTKLPFLCRLFCKDNLRFSEPSLNPNGQNVNLSRVGTRIHDARIGTWTQQQAHPLYYQLHCKMWIITISQLVLKFCLGVHFENVCIQVASRLVLFITNGVSACNRRLELSSVSLLK